MQYENTVSAISEWNQNGRLTFEATERLERTFERDVNKQKIKVCS